ncbi:16S rRNA (guanine(527)-N(7))-methyltransferase RsmG [Ovoidimarina sediminis]|uniref:16S rRNA (guanine(527)-N(7))-methyltransferase RsmG n=1 Tax=Ovoidimarina sediminis TaxID=3079856 RepID=UPI0029117A95|nr:16S rRNA (guanine(527)-N(7))-methyltransferase RsmG [Rhodophyticola sp. MJ-SS7]MDU8942538.1 16S rRNA (guanine(527)-N(7))-methyltransferase RsmG [Rhodophyticola sp. MJ-SS7]
MTGARNRLAETFDVSRETLARLDAYEAQLQKWSPKINLVSKTTLGDAWERHFLDSAQLSRLAPEGPLEWVDLGSGGGFPGLVVSILRPEVRMTLIESDRRKSVFLNTVIREVGANARVITARIEDVEPQGADVVSARALAALETLLDHALRHGSPECVALFPRGAQSASDVSKALETHRFHCETHPSLSSEDGSILRIMEFARV